VGAGSSGAASGLRHGSTAGLSGSGVSDLEVSCGDIAKAGIAESLGAAGATGASCGDGATASIAESLGAAGAAGVS